MQLLTKVGRATPLRDVAKALSLDKATTYRLLQSLCAGGLVQNIANSGSYALGPTCLAFAEGYRKSFTMRDMVLPFLEKLVNLSGETAIYCQRYGPDSCVTVERWDSPHDTRTFSGTGIVRPLIFGSSALAILAMLPNSEVNKIVELRNGDQESLSTREKKLLMDRIAAVKVNGYAISMRERDLDTGGIAAPVSDDHNVFGSLAVIGPVDRMKRSGLRKLGKQVQRIASDFSNEMRISRGDIPSFSQRNVG